MFVPTGTNSPLKTVTTDQREALRNFFGNCVENDVFDFTDPLMVALVLSGDKPAASIDPSTDHFPDHRWTPHTGLKELCDTMNIVAYKRRDLGWWFVAPVYGRLDLLPSSNRTERSDEWMRRLGVIFGYPSSAIDYFLGAKGEWTEPRERVANGQFSSDEMVDAGFVVYRHDDSVEGYERAIETGRRIRDRLEGLAEEWDVPELATVVSEHQQQLLDEVTPEKTVQ